MRNPLVNNSSTIPNRTKISKTKTFTLWIAVSKPSKFKTTCKLIMNKWLHTLKETDSDLRVQRQLQRLLSRWGTRNKWLNSSRRWWTSRIKAGCSSNKRFFNNSKWMLQAIANKRWWLGVSFHRVLKVCFILKLWQLKAKEDQVQPVARHNWTLEKS